MVIEAFQLNERGLVAENWFWDAVSANEIITYNFGKNYADPAWFEIKTLEGVMLATAGDYIIQGVQGEIYPCKPDIFLATYEKVEDDKDTGYFSHGGTWVKNIPDVERGGVGGFKICTFRKKHHNAL